MLTYSLLIDENPSLDASSQWVRQIADTFSLSLSICNDFVSASELFVANDSKKPLIIFFGPSLRSSVTVARRLHELLPLAHFIFLPGENSAQLEKQLKSPVSGIGHYWNIVNSDSVDMEQLKIAITNTRQRYKLRTTIGNINKKFGTLPFSDVASTQRYAVSLRFLDNILENAHDAIIATDNGGMIIRWNRSASSLFEIPYSDTIGKPIAQIALGEWRETVPQLLADLNAKQTPYKDKELRCTTVAGTELYIDLMLSVILNEFKEAIGISLIARDVSDKHRTLEALKSANAQLDKKNREMEQFVYIVSHDLKSPLVTISGFTTILRKELLNNLNERQIHRFDRILDNVTQMQNMLAELLSISRIIRQELERESVDVEDLLESMLKTMEASINESGGKIHIESPLHKVTANRRLLSQCLQNLISNALKYRDPTRPLLVAIATEKTPDHVLISVSDNGLGIDPQFHDKVFGLFERLDVGEGTGVGLAIIRTIMERHGGEVLLKSQPGHGSRFSLLFPAGSSL